LDLEKVPGGHVETVNEEAKEQAMLLRAAKIARWLTVFLTLALLVLWPMPMYGSGYVFSKPFFTGWVSIGILWMFCSAFCVGLYPLFEGRHTMSRTAIAIFRDITGKGKRNVQTHHGQVVEETESNTPVEKDMQSMKQG